MALAEGGGKKISQVQSFDEYLAQQYPGGYGPAPAPAPAPPATSAPPVEPAPPPDAAPVEDLAAYEAQQYDSGNTYSTGYQADNQGAWADQEVLTTSPFLQEPEPWVAENKYQGAGWSRDTRKRGWELIDEKQMEPDAAALLPGLFGGPSSAGAHRPLGTNPYPGGSGPLNFATYLASSVKPNPNFRAEHSDTLDKRLPVVDSTGRWIVVDENGYYAGETDLIPQIYEHNQNIYRTYISGDGWGGNTIDRIQKEAMIRDEIRRAHFNRSTGQVENMPPESEIQAEIDRRLGVWNPTLPAVVVDPAPITLDDVNRRMDWSNQ